MRKVILKYSLRIFKKLQKFERTEKLAELQKSGLLKIGEYTYGKSNLRIDSYKGSEEKVEIGKFCSIGPDVRIITGGIHPVDWVSTFPFRIQFDLEGKFEDGMPKSNGPVTIGNDVWIGTNATILSGINIGHGAVIASGAMITKDVEPYTIVGGNPAKLIRFRFDDKEKIDKLLELEWWNWPLEKIMQNIEFLNSPNIETLL